MEAIAIQTCSTLYRKSTNAFDFWTRHTSTPVADPRLVLLRASVSPKERAFVSRQVPADEKLVAFPVEGRLSGLPSKEASSLAMERVTYPEW